MKYFIIVLFVSSLAQAFPKAVILLRHAEEPKGNVAYLSKDGIERSRRLPELFRDNKKLAQLGSPDYLFAAGAKHDDSSQRSVQTLHFLSKELEIPIDDSFMRDDIKALTHEILKNDIYDDKVLVVCWQHKLLTLIAERLGVKKAPDYPSNKFDRLWIITFDQKGKNKGEAQLKDLPQQLMPGDSKK